MSLRSVWKNLRSFVPVSCYPLLGPIHRWDRERTINQLRANDAIYLAEHPGVSVPNADLRANIEGPSDIPTFLSRGVRMANDIEAAVGRAGAKIEGMSECLDFGCGCGRFLIEASKRWPRIRWSGCDVDARGVEWCQANLAGVLSLVNDPLPPLPYADGQFDLIFCGSVFTHLNEARQDAWLAELCRILSTEGLLVASVHGAHCWSGLPASTVRRIESQGFVFARVAGDEGIHPEWYQAAWHTQKYVEQHWSQFIAILTYIPQGHYDYQDLIVGRKVANHPERARHEFKSASLAS